VRAIREASAPQPVAATTLAVPVAPAVEQTVDVPAPRLPIRAEAAARSTIQAL
jgi:hypothetical protein